MTILEKINNYSNQLPLHVQREVLDFVEFLESRYHRAPLSSVQNECAESCLDLAKKHGLVGCLKDGLEDLATNKGHFQGYGH